MPGKTWLHEGKVYAFKPIGYKEKPDKPRLFLTTPLTAARRQAPRRPTVAPRYVMRPAKWGNQLVRHYLQPTTRRAYGLRAHGRRTVAPVQRRRRH